MFVEMVDASGFDLDYLIGKIQSGMVIVFAILIIMILAGAYLAYRKNLKKTEEEEEKKEKNVVLKVIVLVIFVVAVIAGFIFSEDILKLVNKFLPAKDKTVMPEVIKLTFFGNL